MLRGCGIPVVENWSTEKRDSTVGMTSHGTVGVETFIVHDQGQCNKDDGNYDTIKLRSDCEIVC